VTENLSALAYLAASVCFILALRGLSSPVTARSGNLWGIVGMVIAVILASVNIFGGFLVTQRMLAMFKKKQK